MPDPPVPSALLAWLAGLASPVVGAGCSANTTASKSSTVRRAITIVTLNLWPPGASLIALLIFFLLVFWFLSTIGRCGRGRWIPPWSRASLGDRRKAGIT